MKYISSLLSRLHPVKIFLTIILSVVLLFGSSFPALAAKSSLSKGTVQLDKIEQKAEEAIDSPAMSLETIEKRSQGALNEVQGNAADQDKMRKSSDTTLPVVKKFEKALDKMKKS